MHHMDLGAALTGYSVVVSDWSGSTCVDEALGKIQRLWLRRMLEQVVTIVLLITDWLERDDIRACQTILSSSTNRDCNSSD